MVERISQNAEAAGQKAYNVWRERTAPANPPHWHELSKETQANWCAVAASRNWEIAGLNNNIDQLEELASRDAKLVDSQRATILALEARLKEAELARDKHSGIAQEATEGIEGITAVLHQLEGKLNALEAEKSAVLMALATRGLVTINAKAPMDGPPVTCKACEENRIGLGNTGPHTCPGWPTQAAGSKHNCMTCGGVGADGLCWVCRREGMP